MGGGFRSPFKAPPSPTQTPPFVTCPSPKHPPRCLRMGGGPVQIRTSPPPCHIPCASTPFVACDSPKHPPRGLRIGGAWVRGGSICLIVMYVLPWLCPSQNSLSYPEKMICLRVDAEEGLDRGWDACRVLLLVFITTGIGSPRQLHTPRHDTTKASHPGQYEAYGHSSVIFETIFCSGFLTMFLR